jgi:hypothetical protein
MRFITLSALVLGISMSFLPALAGGGMAKFLTPEERELYRQQQMPHGRAVTADQRQAVAAQMRQQWAAMSPADKQPSWTRRGARSRRRSGRRSSSGSPSTSPAASPRDSSRSPKA